MLSNQRVFVCPNVLETFCIPEHPTELNSPITKGAPAVLAAVMCGTHLFMKADIQCDVSHDFTIRRTRNVSMINEVVKLNGSDHGGCAAAKVVHLFEEAQISRETSGNDA